MLRKTTEAQAHNGREANASRKAAVGPMAAAIAPPGYVIDFLNRDLTSENQPAVHPINRYDLSATTNAKHPGNPTLALSQVIDNINPIETARVSSLGHQYQAAFNSQPPSPTIPLPGLQRTIPNKPHSQTIPPSPNQLATDGRSAVNFLAIVQQSQPKKSSLFIKSPTPAEKTRLPREAWPVTGKDVTSPAEIPDAVNANPQPAPILPVAKAEMAQPTTELAQATPVSAPSLAGSFSMGSTSDPAEAVPFSSQPLTTEALVTGKSRSLDQEKVQEKLDVASSEMATSAASAEFAESTDPIESATPGAHASEPQTSPEHVASDPTPISDDHNDRAGALLDTSFTENQQAAAIDRAEQADRVQAAEQAAQQREAEQEQERAETQPEEQIDPQVGAGQEDDAASIELSPSEKAAGLAAVGEDAGGNESVPTEGKGIENNSGGKGKTQSLTVQTPDTARMSPEAGLAAAVMLPVSNVPKALSGVGEAANSAVQDEGERLQSEMPKIEVGGEADGTAVRPLVVTGETDKIERAQTPRSQPVPTPKPLPESPPLAIRNIPPVVVASATGSSTAAAQQLQSSIQALPTTDPSLNVSVGPPPILQLVGDADPTQINDQQEKLNAGLLAQRLQGAAEVAAPAGENDIRVRRPKELLKTLPLATPISATVTATDLTDETIAVIAEEKKGGEVRTVIRQARGEIAARRAEHQSKVAEEQRKTRQQLTAIQTENANQQNAVCTQAQREVAQARVDWSEEQERQVAQADEKTQVELAQAYEKIAYEQQQADKQSSQHIIEGERQAERYKGEAETEAERKKREADNESQGAFDWITSKASAFFETLKQELIDLFETAKRRIRSAIEQAKKLALAAIEKARAAVVSIIRGIGAVLIAIGDALLATFPALRTKWRTFIENKVKAAENSVNQLADALKRDAQKLLDALGNGLKLMLDLYKAGMMMAVNAAKATALGAVKFAQLVADNLGAFVVLVKDIAQNPGQWLANLAAAVKDGIRNHLWKAFSSAVKNWFNNKIEQVLGLGHAIWNILKKGGIALKDIVAMVWEGLKAAIPTALISLLIEKLAAMIIPAAGAVMVVIEGLKAAWGSTQRIFAAIGQFVDFLKAVKTGGAGPQFAAMLAAAAVVVIDFVANWLLRKLRGPASKISGKIKAIVQRIIAKIKAVAKKAGGWLRGKFHQWKKSLSHWREIRKNKRMGNQKERKDLQRLDRTVNAIRPKLRYLLERGVSKLRLRAMLMIWRRCYRIKYISLDNNRIIAANSPAVQVETVVTANLTKLQRMIYEAASEVMADPKVQQAQSDYIVSEKKATATNAANLPDSPIRTVTVMPGAGYLGAALALRDPNRKAGFREPHTFLNMPFAPWVVNQQQSVKGPGGIRIGSGWRIPKRGQRKINYDALVNEVNAFGINDKVFAKHLSMFVTTGHAAEPFQKPEIQAYLANFARIVFAAETSRSTSFTIEGPMLLSLITSGQISLKDAFARDSSVNPMTMVGAAAANRLYTDRILGQPDPPTTKRIRDDYQKVVQRRKELLICYIMAEVIAKNLVFRSEDDFMIWAQKELLPLIVERARRFYGISESLSLTNLKMAIPAYLQGRWDQKTVGQA